MKRLLGLFACMLPLLSVAEFVVPIGSVEEYVNIRMIPDDKSEIVGRLFQGDSAPIVNSLPEWYEVEIAGGATGYISAEWTIVLDALPAPVVSEATTPAVVGKNKENIVELTPEEALDALANIEPVTFNYKQEDQERYVGFTAGNVPDLIASSESEGLKPLEIVAVLTRVVKLQQHQIAELESRLADRD
jgi:hypothetical protein